MPYIEPSDRKTLEQDVALLAENIFNEGELNYVISRLLFLKGTVEEVPMGKKLTAIECHDPITGRKETRYTSYKMLNTVIGAVESAKAEFQRRVVAPYEDIKIKTNGDIY